MLLFSISNIIIDYYCLVAVVEGLITKNFRKRGFLLSFKGADSTNLCYLYHFLFTRIIVNLYERGFQLIVSQFSSKGFTTIVSVTEKDFSIVFVQDRIFDASITRASDSSLQYNNILALPNT